MIFLFMLRLKAVPDMRLGVRSGFHIENLYSQFEISQIAPPLGTSCSKEEAGISNIDNFVPSISTPSLGMFHVLELWCRFHVKFETRSSRTARSQNLFF